MTRTGEGAMSGQDRDPVRGWSSATGFRSFLIERLGEGWKVEIVARTPDRDKGGEVRSVAAVASRSDNVRLHVTHDRGADVVLLAFEDGPQVPFEDLAVAKGEIETGDLVNLGIAALANPPGNPAFDLETTLRLICEWKDELAGDLDPANRSMGRKLKEISKEFETALTLYCRRQD